MAEHFYEWVVLGSLIGLAWGIFYISVNWQTLSDEGSKDDRRVASKNDQSGLGEISRDTSRGEGGKDDER